MNSNTISVLGCGWLGLPLADLLVTSGKRVKGSTTSEDRFLKIEKIGAIPFLLCFPNPDSEHQLKTFFTCDVLIITIPFLRTYENPWEYHQLILKVLGFAKRYSVSKIIFTSSTSIYSIDSGYVNESSTISLETDRQKVLSAVEMDILSLKGVVLRLGGLYGFDRPINKTIRCDKPVNIIHQVDAVGILMAIINSDFNDEIFNVVSDEHRNKLGINISGTTDKIVSNAKLKEKLGYVFVYPTASEI